MHRPTLKNEIDHHHTQMDEIKYTEPQTNLQWFLSYWQQCFLLSIVSYFDTEIVRHAVETH
jgi:hypothetical protein